ncbi:preprotein translocase subunit SecG [Rickettsiales bacterium (ex Bugula neritina AB1)]|nr:preprotein translocase subunit SecG [Rickettsiales bacterium (ex Bugula neritina AB1)]
MNLFIIVPLLIFHFLLSILLCFIVLLQKTDGSLAVSSNPKNNSSRSENEILVNLTIYTSIIFFLIPILLSKYFNKEKASFSKRLHNLV